MGILVTAPPPQTEPRLAELALVLARVSQRPQRLVHAALLAVLEEEASKLRG